ncbi:DNA damage-regulated autophagy modulator protein 2-like [Dendronephthya gigantea]|uniref:DNA damage-regulated autophagy modulator protein 2-like n=1 Tax=Dendronephthya gigantea TaxID=151771 RepID=UPI00106BEF9D|nr:DNA damage-regulated autophagy modulator protein 2-like [Dendronephthya gigantea]
MSGRCPCGANYLPVLFASILFISIITSFVIAVARSDITPWFPAISDTATKTPESNVFSQLVNIATFIGLILIYVRYLQVKRDVQLLEGGQNPVILNRYSLPIGLIAILGCSFVANFPECQVPIVHIIGAMVLFIFGNIYVWVQVVVSFHMKRFGIISQCIFNTRLILAILSTISFFLTLFIVHAATKKTGSNLHWHSSDPGFKEHIVGNVFEWVMVFCFLLVFLTFTRELQQNQIQVRLVDYEASYDPIPVQPENI